MINLLTQLKTALIELVILMTALVGLQVPMESFGGVQTNEQTLLSQIATEQEAYKNTYGKYKHYPKYEVGNYEISVDEYQTAKGEVGYRVRIFERNARGIVIREISEGVGVENVFRKYDRLYNEISTVTSTTTSWSRQLKK